MEKIRAATEMFLRSANIGELKHFKRLAEALNHALGIGVPEIVENTKDDLGRRAIHHAAAGGSVNVLRYLIEEIKVDVDVKDGKGITPINWTAIEGRLAAAEYLLQMGANPEIPNDLNVTPLHNAAGKGRNDIIPLLLSKGMNVDAMDAMGNFGAPLHFAISFGKHDTVKLLLDHGANPNLVFRAIYTPLFGSVESKHLQCVEHLLKAGADPNLGPDGTKVLQLAAVDGTPEIIEQLVKAGADANATHLNGLKPIEAAAIQHTRRSVEILFPVTSPIPSYVDWSVNGIMKPANLKKLREKMSREAKENFLEAKSRGKSAFERKEYWMAVHWYTQAVYVEPGNADVLTDRSICYAYLNQRDLAYNDAIQCLVGKPYPKAFYKAGVALKMLNMLSEARVIFYEGLKADPQNKELEDAFREVSLAG